MASRIYLKKNDLTENPKRPYFTLFLIPEDNDPDQDWKEIGAFWKAKSGNGYSGSMKDEVTLDVSALPARPAPGAAPVTQKVIQPQEEND